MFQTSYTGIVPLHSNKLYWGGICRLWCIPVEHISSFPRINTTQYLVDEPLLIPGAKWFGPLPVPPDNAGISEEMERTKAGLFYKIKLEAVHIGDSMQSRVNLENMAYSRFIVVAKVRAGGFYMIIGTVDSPLTLTAVYETGKSLPTTAQTKLSFTTEQISKSLILPSFTSDTLAPTVAGPDDGNNSSDMQNQKEIIPFTNQSEITIPWTSERIAKFKSFPIIEVWIKEDGVPPRLLIGGVIEADQPPPATTLIHVKIGTPATGYIVIA